MPKVFKNKIVFDKDDWMASLAPDYSTSRISKIGNGLAFVRSFNPYRNLGYASPGFMPTDLTNVAVVDAAQIKAEVNGTFAYTIGGTKIQQITIATNAITTPTTFPKTIAHGAHTSIAGQDLCVYYTNISSTRTKMLFYAFNDNTDGDIGTYDFTTTFDDDWMSTVPTDGAVLTKTTPKRLIVGHDDTMYISDGNLVKGFDGATGTNGTFLGTVLTLPKDYIITGFVKTEPRMLVVFAYKDQSDAFNRGKVTVFFWNYLDADIYKGVDINDNYVDAAFDYNGVPACFTQGNPTGSSLNRSSRLQIYDGIGFKAVTDFKGDAPVHGGVEVTGNMIRWASKGVIYSYSNPFFHSQAIPIGMNILGEGTGTSRGLLKTISGTTTILSSGTTTSGGLQNVSSNYYFQSIVATALAQPNFDVRKIGHIEYVKIKFKGTATGGRNVLVQLYDSTQSLGEVIGSAENLKEITSSNVTLLRDKTITGATYTDFDELRAVVSWGSGIAATDAPIVDTIEVFFSTKTLNIS